MEEKQATARTEQSDQNSNCAAGAVPTKQTDKDKDSLDSLLITLKQQINNSDWLEKNTAEKWTNENPELAKEYMEAMKKP